MARMTGQSRSTCLDDSEVLALASGALASGPARALLAHLGTCDLCRRLVAEAARARTPPPQAAGALAAAPEPPTLPIEDAAIEPPHPATIDRYKILDCLGKGGMGVVYAAHDPELDRRIALKLVRVDRGGTDVLRQRLVREAQAMARVQHPNVLAVYDAGVVEDQVFIAMELVDGSTLSAWQRAAPRAWREIVQHFVLAGRGLQAAHAAGLVHRDFKPDNVLVGKDGRVRVCDFGLALPTAPGDPAAQREPAGGGEAPSRFTQTGALVGTPAYMAPEQLRGELADVRSDQFSFCVALYEALAGVRPFAEHGPSLLSAIEAGPPGLPMHTARDAERAAASGTGRARPRVPPAVHRAVVRGLAAAPSQRWPTMEALLAELERALARRPRLVVNAVLAMLVLAAVGWGVWRPPRPVDAPPAFARSVHRLTFTPGCKEYPSFIPGGPGVPGGLVFDGDVDGTLQLFQLDLSSGETRQLTHGPGSNRVPLVSPDGSRIAYEHQLEGPRQLRLLRVDGAGGEQVIGPGRLQAGTWLDNQRLAILEVDGTIVSLDVDDAAAARQPLYTDPDRHRFGLLSAFSDGALAVAWWSPPNLIGVGVVAHDRLRVLVDHMPYADGILQVAPGQDAVYFVRRAGAASELVRVSRDGGDALVVSGGITPSRGVTISRDASKLVFSTCTSRAQLVRVAVDGTAALLSRFQPWSDGSPYAVDARRLLFRSDRSGQDQLYLADVTGGDARAVTGLGVRIQDGATSPDGAWLVYATHEPPGLWIAPLDGSAPPRRLTESPDASPRFTHDGSAIIFERAEGLWRVPRGGGRAEALATQGQEPVPSPIDDRVYFLQRDAASERKRLMVTDGQGPATQVGAVLPPGNYWSSAVARDGRHLALVHEGHEIVEVLLGPGAAPQIRSKLPRWIESLTYAFDGREILASVEYLDGDLWLADGQFR
jgi:serine/threonine protein kinase/dipeptidyl aminopeptidase/acylaminoacyl peptidase